MSPGGQRAAEIDLFFLFLVRTTALNLEAHTYIQAAIIRRTFDISWRGKDRLICSHVSAEISKHRRRYLSLDRSDLCSPLPIYVQRSVNEKLFSYSRFIAGIVFPLPPPFPNKYQGSTRVKRVARTDSDYSCEYFTRG